MKMMKLEAMSVILLAGSVSGLKLNSAPDVFGPNGEGYTNESANIDLDKIGIDFLNSTSSSNSTLPTGGPLNELSLPSAGPNNSSKCQNGFLTTVAWSGYLAGDGKEVTRSSEEGNGLPLKFTLGASEVFKCWDLATTQLKVGDKVKLTCPSEFVWGGAKTVAPFGGDDIPPWSDVNFEYEVINCNEQKLPQKADPQPVTTTMQPEECMYLKLEVSDDISYDLVLSSQEENWASWWPGKFCTFEEKVLDEPSQQWFYNEKEGSLTNGANPSYKLDFHNGWLFLADMSVARQDKDFPSSVRRWYFDPKSKGLTTDIEGVKSQVVFFGNPNKWGWAEVGPSELVAEKQTAQFKIEYCYHGLG